MKNYLNYIKESKEQEDLIRVCIEKEVFKPINLIKDINIKDYLEENFTMFKPSSVKACMKYLNLDIEKINKVYAFLDNIFTNLEEKISDKHTDSIFYKFNNVVIAEYDKNFNFFYYHYDKIYKVLESNFKLNNNKINDLIRDKVEEYLNFSDVIPILLKETLPDGGRSSKNI